MLVGLLIWCIGYFFTMGLITPDTEVSFFGWPMQLGETVRVFMNDMRKK